MLSVSSSRNGGGEGGNGGGGEHHHHRSKTTKTALFSVRTALHAAALIFMFLCTIWLYFLVQILATDVDDIGSNSSSSKHKRGAAVAAASREALSRAAAEGASGAAVLRAEMDSLSDLADSWRRRGEQQHSQTSAQAAMDSPLLVFACRRPQYLERALSSVFRHHPAQRLHHNNNINETGTGRMVGSPIIISQDGDDSAVRNVVEDFRRKFASLGVPMYRIRHNPPDPYSLESESQKKGRRQTKMAKWEIAYRLLAAHYGWALERVFDGRAYSEGGDGDGGGGGGNDKTRPRPPLPQRVIILEEDIEVGADFFSFMNATADLLDSDSSLLAASAFNDNGKKGLVSDTRRLVRSDFFPGLGWMMSRKVWYGREGDESYPYEGLKHRWPNGFWDDWIREPSVRRGRQVIRPEVSRDFHFGDKGGASQGQFNKDLHSIVLDANADVRWEDEDLSYLDEGAYAEAYWKRVYVARRSSGLDRALELAKESHGDIRLTYRSLEQFGHFAQALGIMKDEKAGVPRTAYEGIVELHVSGCTMFLTPPYVDRGTKYADFGRKAGMDLSKDELLQKLELL